MTNQLRMMIQNNKYISFLNDAGVETNTLVSDILQAIESEKFDIFVNNHHRLLSPNAYIESLIFERFFHFQYENKNDALILDFNLKIDIKTMIATSKSLIQRPDFRKPSVTKKGFTKPHSNNGFIIIARFERELCIEDYSNKEQKKGYRTLEGLLPSKVDINPLVDRQPSNYIWLNRYYWGEPFIQGFCVNINSVESPCVLWMNSRLLQILGLKLDNYKNGLRAINDSNEVILEFRYWRDQLIGNGSSFVGTDSNIAKLEGCDLILREDYFAKILQIIPNAIYYVKTI
ncbi:hypothetical protein FK216_06895 [Moraxellaceae bacterium AER2_44_116]|nr:hypothetical protein [Moraxellaceae bacterium]TQC98016.1 hypothetical protein FK216_06895 [Moraxellaceae bacterium AER2_44_116]